MAHNRMQEATDRLMCVFQKHAAVLVSYQQGGITIPNVLATVGRTPFDVVDGEVMLAHESRDYIIKKSDLFVSGVQITPASGDRITEEDGRIYEVSIPKPFFVLENIGPAGSVFKVYTVGPMGYAPPLPTPPVITSSATIIGVQGQFLTYQIVATNGPTSYGAIGLPSGLTVDTVAGIVSGTPTVNGTFNVIVTATNIYGTASQTVTAYLTSSSGAIVDNTVVHGYSALKTPPDTQPTLPQLYPVVWQDADGNWFDAGPGDIVWTQRVDLGK